MNLLTMANTHIGRPMPAYLHRPRTVRPTQIQVHSTRGRTTPGKQVTSLLNWFSRADGDLGGWGSSADYAVGPYDADAPSRENGPVSTVVLSENPHDQFASWAAGYGGRGPAHEWGAGETSYSVEVAQSQAREAYSDKIYTELAELVLAINEEHRRRGWRTIPLVHIPFWDQRRDRPVPAGFTTHEGCENGRKLGKTDPGDEFDFPRLFARVRDLEGARVSASAGSDPTPLGRSVEERLAELESWQRDHQAKATATQKLVAEHEKLFGALRGERS